MIITAIIPRPGFWIDWGTTFHGQPFMESFARSYLGVWPVVEDIK